MQRSAFRTMAALLGGIALLASVASAQNTAKPPYLNPKLPARVRAADLVHRMTLREKASQLVNAARAIPRLGVPAYNWWSEALHGDLAKGTTEFPEPIGLGATFDPRAFTMAHDIAMEGRVVHEDAVRAGGSTIFHGLDFWAPNINIFRDPRWGRGQETYGEDPFLTGAHGGRLRHRHAGHEPALLPRSSPPPSTSPCTADPSPCATSPMTTSAGTTFEDTYLPAFRAAIVEGQADSVMCAYNAVNGEPACANSSCSQHPARRLAVPGLRRLRLRRRHRHLRPATITAPTQPQASAIAVERGMDNECADFRALRPGAATTTTSPTSTRCSRAICPSTRIDTALIRLFTARIRAGHVRPASMDPYSRIPTRARQPRAPRARAAPRRASRMVLLKNDGVLPLKP